MNDAQASRALDRVEELGFDLRNEEVLLLGLGFRPEVKEDSCSTAYLLKDELATRGATALVHDPLYSDRELQQRGFQPGDPSAPELPPVVVLVTEHSAYRGLSFFNLAAKGVRVVVDGRNAWRREDVEAAGILYIGIGQPNSWTLRADPVTTGQG